MQAFQIWKPRRGRTRPRSAADEPYLVDLGGGGGGAHLAVAGR